jgi:hypothetical protein
MVLRARNSSPREPEWLSQVFFCDRDLNTSINSFDKNETVLSDHDRFIYKCAHCFGREYGLALQIGTMFATGSESVGELEGVAYWHLTS